MHPFYHLLEASVGKNIFYDNYRYLAARATPFGDKCLPEELVHGVQAVEASVDQATYLLYDLTLPLLDRARGLGRMYYARFSRA